MKFCRFWHFLSPQGCHYDPKPKMGSSLASNVGALRDEWYGILNKNYNSDPNAQKSKMLKHSEKIIE